jgi:exopolysaccharide production protein ExoZ
MLGNDMSGKPIQLKGIQFGRGMAACLVVLYHAGRMLAEPQYVGHTFILTSLFRFGNAGVDFFFVLSGFIIFYVHSADIGRPERLPHYLWQRISRIYPIYWVVTVLVMAILIAKHDWLALNPQRAIASVLLLPNGQEPILEVAWTLLHEVAFYALFAIAIVSAPAGLFFATAFLLLATFPVPNHLTVTNFLQTPYHYEFALGVFAALCVQRAWFGPKWLIGILGLVGFVAGAWIVNTGTLGGTGTGGRLWFGVASCLLIIGAAEAELCGQLKIPALGSYLGAASYSIYLIHTIAIGFGAKAFFAIPLAHEVPITIALLDCLFAVIVGCALHSTIEKPLLNFIRGKSLMVPARISHS